MLKRIAACALAGTLLVLAPRVFAVEPLLAEQLKTYCVAESGGGQTQNEALCIAYITGFLDGAVATDERVAENVADELERDNSFTERALRTRMVRRMRDRGPTVYAGFCVGNPVPIAEVVEHVVEELTEAEIPEGRAAQIFVYNSLRKHYPCDPED